jgi:predicted nucleic acid-binding protein
MGPVILLDTNVVSELMKSKPDQAPDVLAYLDTLEVEDLYLSSAVLAELRFGIMRSPPGKRRSDREMKFKSLLDDGFKFRVLAFDARAAESYAALRFARERAGRPVALADAMIGAIALANGAALATRNLSDFDGYGLTLINPWAKN